MLSAKIICKFFSIRSDMYYIQISIIEKTVDFTAILNLNPCAKHSLSLGFFLIELATSPNGWKNQI
jgi:hypothetical protein